jgi:hypothetical protein
MVNRNTAAGDSPQLKIDNDEATLAPNGNDLPSKFEQECLAEGRAAEEAWLNGDQEGWARAAVRYRRT